ncbi:hypothetical protein [Rhodococcus globerulus]|uniref:hypothetical protein n=1 Tax=Rhodococcus globerulus TaxID=33008 RepID=UPI000B818FDF|nr:hypothetical protein [Rhodococcus globerulus]
MSDLDALLARPGFRGGLIDTTPEVVGKMLPLLDDAVAITVAGPVAVNDSGKYAVPTVPGDPLVCTPGLVSLRLKPSALGSVVTTDAEQHLPPTLRMFDTHGSSSHTTYLTPTSDRLAFEAIRTAPETARETRALVPVSNTPAFWAEADQLMQLDFILEDGGTERRNGLVALGAFGYRRIDPQLMAAAMEHLSHHQLPVTTVVAGNGCLQIHRGDLDAAAMFGGTLTLASDTCRTMIDLNGVSECWLTRTYGVHGLTTSIEVYDFRRKCVVVFTQTGPTESAVMDVWEDVMSSISAAS